MDGLGVEETDEVMGTNISDDIYRVWKQRLEGLFAGQIFSVPSLRGGVAGCMPRKLGIRKQRPKVALVEP
jgi:hypothetical protein